MSLHITKNRIRATGGDANGFLIALADDARLLEWERTKSGSEDFQRMVSSCGRTYWAVRPDRFGPLVLMPWPGLPRPAGMAA